MSFGTFRYPYLSLPLPKCQEEVEKALAYCNIQQTYADSTQTVIAKNLKLYAGGINMIFSFEGEWLDSDTIEKQMWPQDKAYVDIIKRQTMTRFQEHTQG